jgi:predicted nucleic acid-binding protein
VTLIVDAGALFSQANSGDVDHALVRTLFASEPDPLITSEIALAEADYLIARRLGINAELAFLNDLATGRIVVECLTREELGIARDVARRYRDLRLGLADCSLVVLAYRYQTRRIATLNTRDFRAVTPLQGGVFTILPADR